MVEVAHEERRRARPLRARRDAAKHGGQVGGGVASMHGERARRFRLRAAARVALGLEALERQPRRRHLHVAE